MPTNSSASRQYTRSISIDCAESDRRFSEGNAALDRRVTSPDSQAVRAEADASNPSRAGTSFHDAGNCRPCRRWLVTLRPLVPDAHGTRPVGDAGRLDPCPQGRNRAGRRAAGNGNRLAEAFLIGLAAPDVDQHTLGCPFQVGNVQRDQLGTAHRRGKADEQDGSITELAQLLAADVPAMPSTIRSWLLLADRCRADDRRMPDSVALMASAPTGLGSLAILCM